MELKIREGDHKGDYIAVEVGGIKYLFNGVRDKSVTVHALRRMLALSDIDWTDQSNKNWVIASRINGASEWRIVLWN